jgi:hypothetical protein
VDWESATTTPSGLLPILAIDQSVQLSVTAGASLEIGGGAVVAVVPGPLGLTLDLATADVQTGNTNIGSAGLLSDANVLSFTVAGASLFVGSGGALSGDRSGIETTGAVGLFGALTGEMHLVAINAAGGSYVGVETDTNVFRADLVGFAGLDFHVYDSALKLNTVGGTATEKLDWTSVTAAGLSLPSLAVAHTVSLHADGSAAFDALSGTVVGVGSFGLDLGQ